jgi:hypothetical protein
MTIPDYMHTEPPTFEVVKVAAEKNIDGSVTCRTLDGEGCKDGHWRIYIHDGAQPVYLTGAEAIAVAEFITTHVRKRW